MRGPGPRRAPCRPAQGPCPARRIPGWPGTKRVAPPGLPRGASGAVGGMRMGGRSAVQAAAWVLVCALGAGCGGAAGSAGGGQAAGSGTGQVFGTTAQQELARLQGCVPTPNGQTIKYLAADADHPPTFAVPTGTPSIGQTLAGWPSKPAIMLGNCRDTEMWVYLMADSKNFYIAVKVDSTLAPVEGTPDAPWSGDVVQFAFDPQDDRENHPGNPGGYGDDDDEMGMVLLGGQASLFRNIGPGGQVMPPDSLPGGKVAVTRKNGITLYEAAVPWNQIGASVGSTFGFDVAASAGGAPYQPPQYGYEWTQGIIETKWPYAFAQLTVKK
jgi:hypothetical protein